MQNTTEPSRPKKRLRRRWKSIRRVLHAVPEVLLLGAAGLIVPRISRRSELCLAHFLGCMVRFFGIRSRRIATVNLDIVYGDSKTREEKQRILRASYNHAALIMLDYFWFSRKTEQRIKQYCHIGDAVMEQWVSGDFPGIIVTAHVGNWELGGQYIASRGRTMWSVYNPIGSEQTLKALLKFRGASGMKVLAREGAVIGILRALRSNSLIGMVLDQHTDLEDGGMYLDFFGAPATFSKAAGTVARRMNVPICVFIMKYDADADGYTLTSCKVISSDEASRMSPEEITAQVVSVIAQIILDNPEQWLWVYRRWKRFRPEDDLSKFPFYAKIEGTA